MVKRGYPPRRQYSRQPVSKRRAAWLRFLSKHHGLWDNLIVVNISSIYALMGYGAVKFLEQGMLTLRQVLLCGTGLVVLVLLTLGYFMEGDKNG